MTDELYEYPALDAETQTLLNRLGYSMADLKEAMDSMNREYEEIARLLTEFTKLSWDVFSIYYGEPGVAIPIMDRIKARQPRDRIFLKKERRKTQYIPKQNRHAVNMARRH